MATIRKFEELDTWQLARQLNIKLIPYLKALAEKREYELKNQLDAAAGSVMDNIAEGFERSSRLEFVNSLGISKGESGELKSQLYRCLDDRVIDQTKFDELYSDTDILSRKIASFIIYLNSVKTKGLKFKDRLK